MKTSAVIFDLDGVLTDTAEFHFIAWQNIAKQLGIDFTQNDNEALKGVDRQGSLQHMLNKGGITLNEYDFEQLLIAKNQHYLQLIKQLDPSYLYDGVIDCFTKLKASGIKIGLASASKNAAFVINKLGIESWFDFVGDAAKVAHSKPAPDIFLSVAKGLAVSPKQCIGVEDAVAGIKAIKAAKMFAVGIGDEKVLNQADLVFPSTAQLDLDLALIAIALQKAT
jgi:beta-phosphoglucomutase